MKNTGKIVLYDPYLDVLGGGENHILSIVKVFTEEGFSVDIILNSTALKENFARDLKKKILNLNIVGNFIKKNNVIGRFLKTKKYHSLFYVTDGSYFFSGASNNYIFCMYPQRDLYRNTFLNRLKWRNFRFIANSLFTKSYIDSWVRRSNSVIYPYIDSPFFEIYSPYEKERIILSVGRYFGHLHSKRQDILIKAFRKLKQQNKAFKDFKLILIGRLQEEDKFFFESLKKIAQTDKNIELHVNISETELLKFYRKAFFFWHAAGIESDLREHPEEAEHLGIAPLEAMAAGIVTFCHDSGGPREFIKDGFTGFLYNTVDELVEKTILAFRDKKKRLSIIEESRSFIEKNFSYSVFKEKVKEYFSL